ncbi:hypothetical protein FOZ63_002489, partial [Perkinsus olseni]
MFGSKDNRVVQDVAAAHGVQEADVCLRWALQSGIVTIPKTSNLKRVASNMTTISSFELTDDEMARIAEEADIGFKASSACEAMTLEFARYNAPLAFMMIKLTTIGIIGFVSHLSEVAALFFELKPHAQVECFGLPEVNSGSVIEGSYDSVGRNGYEGIVATVMRVDGGTPSSVWEGHDPKGRLAVPVGQPGTYKLCFASRTKSVQTVSFSLRIEKVIR